MIQSIDDSCSLMVQDVVADGNQLWFDGRIFVVFLDKEALGQYCFQFFAVYYLKEFLCQSLFAIL